MLAVAHNCFPRGQLQPVLRPENSAANAVRNKHGTSFAQLHHARVAQIKIRKVLRHRIVVRHGIPQFRRISNAAGNHRVGIKHAIRFSQYGSRRKPIAIGCTCCDFCGEVRDGRITS
jgi:hypothetical protein